MRIKGYGYSSPFPRYNSRAGQGKKPSSCDRRVSGYFSGCNVTHNNAHCALQQASSHLKKPSNSSSLYEFICWHLKDFHFLCTNQDSPRTSTVHVASRRHVARHRGRCRHTATFCHHSLYYGKCHWPRWEDELCHRHCFYTGVIRPSNGLITCARPPASRPSFFKPPSPTLPSVSPGGLVRSRNAWVAFSPYFSAVLPQDHLSNVQAQPADRSRGARCYFYVRLPALLSYLLPRCSAAL